MVETVQKKIDGYKTYGAAIIVVVSATYFFMTGQIDLDTYMQLITGSGFGMTLRSALKKLENRF